MILYRVYRDHGSPVAKATILSINRREVVGGQELGSKYFKVVENYVIERDAILPRGAGNMTIQAFGSGQVSGKCSNAATSKMMRFPKDTQQVGGFEDLEDLQFLVLE